VSVHTGMKYTSPTVVQFYRIMWVLCRIWNCLLGVFYAFYHVGNKISRFGDRIDLRPQAKDKVNV
jgi:hypothetical protein